MRVSEILEENFMRIWKVSRGVEKTEVDSRSAEDKKIENQTGEKRRSEYLNYEEHQISMISSER